MAGTIKSCGPGTPPYSSRRKLFMECRVAGAIYHNVEDVWDELWNRTPKAAIGKQVTIKRNPFEMSGFALFCRMRETQRSAEW